LTANFVEFERNLFKEEDRWRPHENDATCVLSHQTFLAQNATQVKTGIRSQTKTERNQRQLQVPGQDEELVLYLLAYEKNVLIDQPKDHHT